MLTDSMLYVVSFVFDRSNDGGDEEEVSIVVESEFQTKHLWELKVYPLGGHGSVMQVVGQEGSVVFALADPDTFDGITEDDMIDLFSNLPGLSRTEMSEAEVEALCRPRPPITSTNPSAKLSAVELSPVYAAFRSAHQEGGSNATPTNHSLQPLAGPSAAQPTLLAELEEVMGRANLCDMESNYRVGILSAQFEARLALEKRRMVLELAAVEGLYTSTDLPPVGAEVAQYAANARLDLTNLGFGNFVGDGARALAKDHEQKVRQNLKKYFTASKGLLLDKGRATEAAAIAQNNKILVNSESKKADELRDRLRRMKTKCSIQDDTIQKLKESVADCQRREKVMVEKARRRDAELKQLADQVRGIQGGSAMMPQHSDSANTSFASYRPTSPHTL